MKDLVHAFSILESEVNYSRTTLPEGLERTGLKVGGRFGTCLCEISSQMRGGSGILFSAAWDQRIGIWLKETCLREKERELLLSFPGFTGFSDGQLQRLEIQRFGDELKCTERKAAEEEKERRKLIMSLSVMAGIFTAVLLV